MMISIWWHIEKNMPLNIWINYESYPVLETFKDNKFYIYFYIEEIDSNCEHKISAQKLACFYVLLMWI